MTGFINKQMRDYMEKAIEKSKIIHKKNASDFKSDIMLFFNRRAKNGNYYGYDKYGIIIRKDVGNNDKSPFGWKRIGDDIVSIHLRQDTPEENRKRETLSYIQSRFASQWNNKNNILRKIYSRYENGCEEDDEKILNKK